MLMKPGTFANHLAYPLFCKTAQPLERENVINEQDVARFMFAADQKRDDATARLYLGLGLEEIAETLEAEGYLAIARQVQGYAGDIKRGLMPEREPNLLEGFDGGLDTVWVTFGYMLARNFPVSAGWAEVARSNASKLVDGRVIKNESGKVMKPESYSPPDLMRVLNVAGYFG